jgi:hypothetical protein
MVALPDRKCGTCSQFIDDAQELERRLPGILILSSAHGDARGDQGLCCIHERMLTPGLTCSRWEARRDPSARLTD